MTTAATATAAGGQFCLSWFDPSGIGVTGVPVGRGGGRVGRDENGRDDDDGDSSLMLSSSSSSLSWLSSLSSFTSTSDEEEEEGISGADHLPGPGRIGFGLDDGGGGTFAAVRATTTSASASANRGGARGRRPVRSDTDRKTNDDRGGRGGVGGGDGSYRVQTCVHEWRSRTEPNDVLGPLGLLPSLVLEAMGWATAAAAEALAATTTTDAMYSGGGGRPRCGRGRELPPRLPPPPSPSTVA